MLVLWHVVCSVLSTVQVGKENDTGVEYSLEKGSGRKCLAAPGLLVAVLVQVMVCLCVCVCRSVYGHPKVLPQVPNAIWIWHVSHTLPCSHMHRQRKPCTQAWVHTNLERVTRKRLECIATQSSDSFLLLLSNPDLYTLCESHSDPIRLQSTRVGNREG